jgi:hypothetical protein
MIVAVKKVVIKLISAWIGLTDTIVKIALAIKHP